MIDIDKIAWFECSVARYRQGQVLVRLDFLKKVLTWKDSNRWFNDFIRSVNSVQVEELKLLLLELLNESDICLKYQARPEEEYVWMVRVGYEKEPESCFECGGVDNNDQAWISFMKAIERAGEQLIDPTGGH